MSTAIGIISLILWVLSWVAAFHTDDKDSQVNIERHSIAYLAIAAWCFH